MNDPQWIQTSYTMLMDMLSHSLEKVSISTFVAGICQVLQIDYSLVTLCFCMLTGDMILRIICLSREGYNLTLGLKQAIPRYIFYLMFIILSWSVQFTVMRTVDLELPVVDIILGYLILTDCASILEHLISLNVPVPKLIKTIVIGSKRKLEEKTNQVLELDNETEPKTDVEENKK